MELLSWHQFDFQDILIRKTNRKTNVNIKYHYIEKEDCKLETIILNKYANMGEVYNAFKIGNIDLLTTSNINTEGNIGTIGFQTKEYRGRELDYIAFNTTHPVLQNVEVRKAIQAAIDKQNMVQSLKDESK